MLSFIKRFKRNIKAKLDAMSLAVIGATMIGATFLSTLIQNMFLASTNEPVVMGYEIPVFSGLLSAAMFLVIYKYVLKKRNV